MQTMTKKPRKTEPTRARTYRLPESLIAALERAAEMSRRNVTTEIIIAVEEYLLAKGLWTPPEADDDDEDSPES